MTILDLKIGEAGIITHVGGAKIIRFRLLDMGLLPNTLVKIQKIAPFGDPIQIQVRGYELIIRKEIAKKIQIKKEVHDATCLSRKSKFW